MSASPIEDMTNEQRLLFLTLAGWGGGNSCRPDCSFNYYLSAPNCETCEKSGMESCSFLNLWKLKNRFNSNNVRNIFAQRPNPIEENGSVESYQPTARGKQSNLYYNPSCQNSGKGEKRAIFIFCTSWWSHCAHFMHLTLKKKIITIKKH